jgi:hypothetical protein
MTFLRILEGEDPESHSDFAFQSADGAFDPLSLHVTCRARLEDLVHDYEASLYALSTGSPLSQLTLAQKVFAHEMTHYYQTVTTPVGHFLHRLQLIQNKIIEGVLRAFQQETVLPAVPLTKFVPQLPGHGLRNWASEALFDWMILESCVRWLSGDVDGVKTAIRIANRFHDIGNDHPITFIDAIINRVACYWPGGVENKQPVFIPNLLHYRRPSKDFYNLLCTETAAPHQIADILEGMATAAEFWRGSSFDNFKEYIAGRNSARDRPYVYCLKFAMDRIPAKTLAEFICTFLAAAELALAGNVLPSQPNETGEADLWHILPVPRLFFILAHAPGLPVINKISSYAEYVHAVCTRFDWPNPSLIAARDARLGEGLPGSREYIYGRAQHSRLSVPQLCIDYDEILLPTDPNALEDLTPPAISFSDSTNIVGHERMVAHCTIFLLTRVYRAILLGKGFAITIPFPMDSMVLEFLQDNIQKHLDSNFGVRLPGFRLSCVLPP